MRKQISSETPMISSAISPRIHPQILSSITPNTHSGIHFTILSEITSWIPEVYFQEFLQEIERPPAQVVSLNNFAKGGPNFPVNGAGRIRNEADRIQR